MEAPSAVHGGAPGGMSLVKKSITIYVTMAPHRCNLVFFVRAPSAVHGGAPGGRSLVKNLSTST